jgi:hypothetical protein
MRTIFTRLLLMASASFLYVSPLLAGVSDGRAPPPGVDAWVKTVNAKVENAIVEPYGASGPVIAHFRRADNGRAVEVRVDRASPALERAMRVTLRKLRRLPPMPRGVDAHQRVKVQLLFDDGSNAWSYQAERRAMLAAAAEANRRFVEGSTETILALSTGP